MKEHERHERKKPEKGEPSSQFKGREHQKGRQLSQGAESPVHELQQGDAVMQPLYYEEVDHQIEQVGIMAIKEVKYVTEKEWQKMIEMQKNQQEIWKYLESISKYEKRYEIANRIPRNRKGQFAAKEGERPEKAERTQQIRKRGRPRKEQPQ